MEEMPAYRWFFKPPLDAHSAGNNKEAADAAAERSKAAYRRIGSRWIVIKIIESGAFKIEEQTPYESALKMSFKTAVSYLSLKNGAGL